MNEEFNDAAVFGDVEKVNRILEKDSSILSKKDEYGFTVLHNVVGEHYFEIVELLIEHGADVNAQNDEGIAPLHLAAYPETAEILIKRGARVEIESTRGETPLYVHASEQDGFDVLVVLLENGASPNRKNGRGETPIDAARSIGDVDKVELLDKYSK